MKVDLQFDLQLELIPMARWQESVWVCVQRKLLAAVFIYDFNRCAENEKKNKQIYL
jgi:hypothetical protein